MDRDGAARGRRSARSFIFHPFRTFRSRCAAQSFVIVEAVFIGSEADGNALVSQLRRTDRRWTPSPRWRQRLFNTCIWTRPSPVPGVGDRLFLERLPDEAIGAFVQNAVAPLISLEIRQLGGAMASSAQHHGAVGTLDAGYVMFAVGMAPNPRSPPLSMRRSTESRPG